ncbi:GGDEF domain-containing protein [Pseudomonas marginalis]|uniref:diguanylate cyclase n=1 Tax=Pseudomonas marginalis TaxID=298 RepID=A0A9X5KP68_PSEMA|nr:GGDEF domain-containing protein [Pseudomonas marginalis]OAJ45588.1 hypothetical protein AO064_29630 [Pseudomonas marginalis]
MLDIETLYFSSAISRTAILMIFGVLALSQPNITYLRHWSLALLSSGIATLMSLYFSETSVLTPVILGLFMVSLGTSWSGLRLFNGRSFNIKLLLFLTILPCVLYSLAIHLRVPEKITLPFIYFSAASLAGLCLHEILNSHTPRLYSQYFVGVAFAGYSLALAISGALVLIGWLDASAKKSAVASIAVDQIASIFVYFGYIAMAHESAVLDLKRKAETDSLTGLTNRRGGQRVLIKLHADTNENALGGQQYSVLIADIDHFKQINDTFGHEAGDKVLSLISQRLTSAMRKRDSVIRWGGEEFLIVLPNTVIDEAKQMAERLRKLVGEEVFVLGQHQLAVTFSVGIAEYRKTDKTFENTLARADQALYRSKHEGRNRVNCQPPEQIEDAL